MRVKRPACNAAAIIDHGDLIGIAIIFKTGLDASGNLALPGSVKRGAQAAAVIDRRVAAQAILAQLLAGNSGGTRANNRVLPLFPAVAPPRMMLAAENIDGIVSQPVLPPRNTGPSISATVASRPGGTELAARGGYRQSRGNEPRRCRFSSLRTISLPVGNPR